MRDLSSTAGFQHKLTLHFHRGKKTRINIWPCQSSKKCRDDAESGKSKGNMFSIMLSIYNQPQGRRGGLAREVAPGTRVTRLFCSELWVDRDPPSNKMDLT